MKYSKVSKWLMPLLAITLAGCSGSGSTSTKPTNGGGNTGNLQKLTMTAPNSLPAGMAVSVPIVVTNNDSTTINNLNYAIDSSSNTTGATITFESASAASCRVIAPKASCTLMADIAATPASHPGSFNVATSQGSVSSTSKAVTASSVLSVDVNIGLVQSASNTSSGADGLSLYYPSSVVGNADGSTQVIVTAVVSSANAGSFNTIQLVDGSGNLLNYTTLSGNSGNGMTNLAPGSVVTFLVTVPSGSSQLQLKAQTANNGAVVSTAANSNTVIVTDPTATVGIVNILPNYFNLTTGYESQIITVANSGNGPISSLSFTPSSPLTELSNNCAATLAAGASCQYIVKFNKNLPQAGTSGITINYNNGSSAQSATATVNYTGIDPVAGLTISGGNNSNFDFTTRTSTPTQSALVTLTNSGNTNESGFNFSPVANFTTNTTGITNACTASTVLAPTESCSVNLVYTNSTATPTTTTVVPVSYTFGQKGLIASSDIHVTYQTIQSTAILAITPSPASFTGIVNNGVESSSQIINIANSGDDTATAIASSISGTNSALFSIDSTASVTNPCSSSLAAGDSCNLSIKFGPAESNIAAGSESASLDVSYAPYTNATAITTSAALSGQVSGAQSAIITPSATTASGFAGGDGTSGNPYQVQQAATAPTLTYTITNSGTVPATGFYIDGIPSQGWNYTGCGTQQAPVTLDANNGSCMLTITLTPTSVGATNLDLSTLTMHWVDQDSPSGQPQVMNGVVYTNVYVAPSIAITTSGLTTTESVELASNFHIIATLTGGYSVTDQVINLQNLLPTDSAIDISNTCTLNSNQPSCDIPVTVGANTTLQNYSVTANNAGNIVINSGNPVNFSVYDPTPVGSETILGAAAEVGCLILKSNHQPYCWGNNHQGELGIGSFTSMNIPTAILMGESSAIPIGTLFSQISVAVAGDHYGDSSVCAISSSNQVYCWGYNEYGELGNGTTTTSNVAVAVIAGQIPTGVKLTKVSNAGDHVCGVGTDGKAYCWGRNNSGQLGNGTASSSSSPVVVSQGEIPNGITIRDIGTGVRGTCAIASNGKTYCWGNYYSNSSSNTPVLLSGGALPSNYQTIAISLTHDDVSQAACLITDAGSMYCWGNNNEGQLGNGTNISSYAPVLVSQGQIPLGVKWLSVSQGGASTCGMTDQGLGYCWGDNSFGQLGLGNTTQFNTPQAILLGGSSQIPSGTKLIAISGGYDDDGGANAMFCGMSNLGNVYCWGSNTYGQLGYGVTGGTSSYAKAVTMP